MSCMYLSFFTVKKVYSWSKSYSSWHIQHWYKSANWYSLLTYLYTSHCKMMCQKEREIFIDCPEISDKLVSLFEQQYGVFMLLSSKHTDYIHKAKKNYCLFALSWKKKSGESIGVFFCFCFFNFNLAFGAYMWSDLAESVGSRKHKIYSFIFDKSTFLEWCIMLKIPPESNHWFQSYEQLKDPQNNRKQKKFIPFSGYISQSMLPTSRLIPLDYNISSA